MVPNVDNAIMISSLKKQQKIAFLAQVGKFLIKKLRLVNANKKLFGMGNYAFHVIILNILIWMRNNVDRAR
jgi:hypothetical protein